MPGARTSRGRRIVRITLATTLVSLAALAWSADPAGGAAGRPAADEAIRLPAPVEGVDPLSNVDLGLRPDRLRISVVPGTVRNTEAVRVGLGPTGAPAQVLDRQRLVIRGAGGYIVRELGPARDAEGLAGTLPPVLQLGTVIWQGFSPGRRVLSALLTLDPGIEAARLPLAVQLGFRAWDGRTMTLRPDGTAPADGTLTVTLHNNTASTRTVDAGAARPGRLAGVLDELLTAAAHPRPAVPPVAGKDLPNTLPGRRAGIVPLAVTAPLHITGALSAPGGPAAITGPGTTPAADGVRIEGTLTADASINVRLARGERFGLTLDVRPWLDPRTLTPPDGFRTWARWAASKPSRAALRQATSTAVAAAASSARSAEYSPYLQADAPGRHLSTFTYVIAPPQRTTVVASRDVQPRPGGIAAAAVAFLAVLGNAALLRRQL